jgi:hypothetical protein
MLLRKVLSMNDTFIPSFLMWNIWREMNHLHFEDCETHVLSLKFTFLRSLLDWTVVYVPSSSFLNLLGLVNF